MMEMTKDIHTTLRSEAARACRLSRQSRSIDSELAHWYDGRYLAYKQSAALLQIAMEHDEWRRDNGY